MSSSTMYTNLRYSDSYATGSDMFALTHKRDTTARYVENNSERIKTATYIVIVLRRVWKTTR
jgi:hypothetical protein